MKEQVKRVTLQGLGAFEEVSFDNVCGKYLVKNFTEADIYVSYASDATDDTSMKIAPMFAQVCIANEFGGGLEIYKQNKIYVKGLGEVEVQQLCFH